MERERPAMAVSGPSLYYIKDKYLRSYEFEKDRDAPILGIRKTAGLNMQHRTLSYNAAENCVIVTTVCFKLN